MAAREYSAAMRIATLMLLLLFVPPAMAAQPGRLEADLAKAQADYDRDPSSADAAIWLGRRLAYLGRFPDAIDVFTHGIAQASRRRAAVSPSRPSLHHDRAGSISRSPI